MSKQPERLSLPRVAHLVVNLFRGRTRRHVSRAHLIAPRHRLAWQRKLKQVKRAAPHRRTILVGMIEHLGDIVATEPVARYLRELHPDAYIVWAVRPQYRELVETNPHIDATLELGCLTEWVRLAPNDLFDEVVDLHLHGRHCQTCWISLEKSGERRAINFETYYNLGNLLKVYCLSAGLPVLTDAPQVYIPPSCVERVDELRLPNRFAVFHCTSNQDERDWTGAKWRELTQQVGEKLDVPVVEVGLRPVINSIDDSAMANYINLCGELSPLETAEVIRRAQIFVGIDSGPAHLANAVGTYGIILLGQYGPFHGYLPYSGAYADGSNAEIIHAQPGQPASSIPVQRVLESLAGRLVAA